MVKKNDNGNSRLRREGFAAGMPLLRRSAETGSRRFYKAPPGTYPVTLTSDFDVILPGAPRDQDSLRALPDVVRTRGIQYSLKHDLLRPMTGIWTGMKLAGCNFLGGR
jgi:hypothetical protein